MKNRGKDRGAFHASTLLRSCYFVLCSRASLSVARVIFLFNLVAGLFTFFFYFCSFLLYLFRLVFDPRRGAVVSKISSHARKLLFRVEEEPSSYVEYNESKRSE